MERVDGDFVERTIELMVKIVPACFTKPLADLSTADLPREDRRIKRESVLHHVANITVIAAAGLDHALPNRLIPDYHKILKEFSRCRRSLANHSIDVPPQINEAIALMKSPHLDK